MPRLETFNELAHLRDSGFGQPAPRHGLQLLYWFAHDYVRFDYTGCMIPQYDPTDGGFGFKPFHNRIDDDDDRLLPNQNQPYYEVGNLNARYANELPPYVRGNSNHHWGDGNKDRIIIRLDPYGYIDRVYVTEHEDSTNFSHGCTYRISQGLLRKIENMNRSHFLQVTEHHHSKPQVINMNPQSRPTGFSQSYVGPPPYQSSESSLCETCCVVILAAFVLIVLFLFFIASMKNKYQ
ncbi:uncharacterized protein LOC115823821 [Chanos chanos]|uniref:Uncharacterized protein LOC115823821 n=1 Tax=Chanos chanos TaxID=29144 RepID=A0A6J2WHB1_CHACN|nr:uncharacterized protein LOC115823821 [Chanos chanos]